MTDTTFETPEEAATEAPATEVSASIDVVEDDTPEAAPASVEEPEDTSEASPRDPAPQAPSPQDQASKDPAPNPVDDDSDEDDSDDEQADEDEDDDSDDDSEDDDDSDDDDDSEDGGASAKDDEDGERPASRLELEGDIAADYLEELLDIADLDGDIDTFVEGGRAQVSIVTEGDQLVGKDGEVLDALQELARLAVMTETDHRSRLMLDIAGHRDRRRTELTILAKDAIAEVKQSGEAARLAPMNPFERKIIHDIVAEAGLVSESEGVEPKRRVVILP